jgi:hypothetical protein
MYRINKSNTRSRAVGRLCTEVDNNINYKGRDIIKRSY